MSRQPLTPLLLILVGTMLGCSAGQRETTPVGGKVTLAGKPLTTGRIIFWPDDGGPPGGGSIGEDGSYSLTTYQTGDGAVLGTHKVTVEAVTAINPEAAPKSIAEEMANELFYRNPPVKTKQLVPRRYALRQTSGLVAEVAHDVGPIDFDLEPK